MSNTQQPASQRQLMPDWMDYDAATDVLTIHGKRYSAAIFGESGFLAPIGTLLRVEDGQPECVTLTAEQPTTQKQDEPVGRVKIMLSMNVGYLTREVPLGASLYTPPQKHKALTDEQILADETLRYHFGLNSGAGPVSAKGRKIIGAVEAILGIKDKP